jgi:hypothetical protein
MLNESHTVGAEQVSQDTLEAICKLTLSGSTPEAISLAFDLNVQTVSQVIAKGVFASKDLDQEENQCKPAQLAQQLQGSKHFLRSQPSSTATVNTLTSCTGLV